LAKAQRPQEKPTRGQQFTRRHHRRFRS
jgi:hypothetical protein